MAHTHAAVLSAGAGGGRDHCPPCARRASNNRARARGGDIEQMWHTIRRTELRERERMSTPCGLCDSVQCPASNVSTHRFFLRTQCARGGSRPSVCRCSRCWCCPRTKRICQHGRNDIQHTRVDSRATDFPAHFFFLLVCVTRYQVFLIGNSYILVIWYVLIFLMYTYFLLLGISYSVVFVIGRYQAFSVH